MYKHKFKSFGEKTIIRPTFNYLLGAKYISIGDFSKIGKNVILSAWDKYKNQNFTPEITIGNHSNIGDRSHVTCINKIIIGNNVGMGREILITDNSHGNGDISEFHERTGTRPLVSPGPVIIEDNCWIGEKCCILPAVTIGRGSTLGASSVVRTSIPPYSIVVGNPAKVIGFVGTPEEIFEKEKELYPEEERIPFVKLQRNYEKYYLKRLKEIVTYIKP